MGFLRKLFAKRLARYLGGGIAGLLAIAVGTDVAAPTMEKAAGYIADYCEQPEKSREKLRAAFFEHTAPNTVTVFCEGDATP